MNQSGSGASLPPAKFYGGTGGDVPLIFISHSAADKSIAEHLVQFLQSALALRPEQIRCTSVEGHRLRIGAATDSVLKKEVLESKVFVGLISSASIGSAYVLFELGARWGADKTIAPLLAPGAGTDLLKGPLGGINALSCDSEEQLHQLIQDLSSNLGRKAVEPSAYLSDLRALRAAESTVPQAKSTVPEQDPDRDRSNVPLDESLSLDELDRQRKPKRRRPFVPTPGQPPLDALTPSPELSDDDCRLFRFLAEATEYAHTRGSLELLIQWEHIKIQYHLDKLFDRRLIRSDRHGLRLTKEGRSFWMENCQQGAIAMPPVRKCHHCSKELTSEAVKDWENTTGRIILDEKDLQLYNCPGCGQRFTLAPDRTT